MAKKKQTKEVTPSVSFDSPWFFSDGVPPEKAVLMEDMGALEDFLQHNKVFINGLSGRTAHMDSYMTVVDFIALEKALALLTETYKLESQDWVKPVTHWLMNPNMQPPALIIGVELDTVHKLGIWGKRPKTWEE
jgi:hypothetical protein